MRKTLVSFTWLAIGTAGLIAGAGLSQTAKPPIATAKIDLSIMHVQVILDRLGFSPGVIDGKAGQSLTLALRGFQEARGLTKSGKMDPATLKALYPYRQIRPTTVVTISAADAAGPFLNPMPDEPADQAKLKALSYRSLLEKLSERFHTSAPTLVALNGPATMIGAGRRIVVPSALPVSRDYDTDNAEWRATLSSLNVDARQPEGKRIVVDKSDGALRVYDAEDRLVAQFPATMGSQYDPLPIGNWTVKGAAYNPPFNYNPDLFWDAKAGDEKAKLPPGPNGPVGVVWLDMSKEHYGIHGTPEPEKIGRTESHGCIRLTNWDAARLALIIGPGTPAKFQT